MGTSDAQAWKGNFQEGGNNGWGETESLVIEFENGMGISTHVDVQPLGDKQFACWCGRESSFVLDEIGIDSQ